MRHWFSENGRPGIHNYMQIMGDSTPKGEKMANKYLYDSTYNGKRLVVSKDLYNWIVMYGSATANDESFEKTAEHWYYTSLENMFARLFVKLHRLDLKSLETRDILTAIGKVESRMMDIGAALDRKGVENGWR